MATDQIINNYLGRYTLKLSPDFEIENYFLQHGHWEQHVIAAIEFFVREGDTCIDVGANSGFHTIAMAGKVGATGHVYAFEPNDITHPRLIENLSLNPDLQSRVTVEKAGLSDHEGTLKLFQSGDRPGNAYMSEELDPTLWNAGGPEDYLLCPIVTLDSYLNGKPVSFMKIDVEGMELDVIRGALRTIKRSRPIISYETLTEYFNNEKIKQLEDLLRNADYQLFGLHPAAGKLVPVSFPNYGPDTFAIPTEKIIQFSGAMLNAALFEVTGVRPAGVSKLLVTCYDRDKFKLAALSPSNESQLIPLSASYEQGTITAQGYVEGKEFALSVPLCTPNGDLLHDMQTEFYGKATTAGQTDAIALQCIAGEVVNFAHAVPSGKR